MKIKKVSGTAILNGNVVDSLEDNSATNAPSQRAVNEALNGYILYENSSGSSSDIALKDSVANYEYIEIFYKDDDNYYASQKIYSPNGKRVNLFTVTCDGSQYEQFKAKVIEINENTLTNKSYGQAYNGGVHAQNKILITRIVGYKMVN